MRADEPIRDGSFEYEGWRVDLVCDGVRRESTSSHADLFFDGVHKCRIAVSGQRLDEAAARESLSRRARAFIDDWRLQRHSGNTGFASL